MIKMLPDVPVYSVHVRTPFSLISAYWYFEMWCVTMGFNLSYQFTEPESMNTSHVLSIMYTCNISIELIEMGKVICASSTLPA